MLNKSKLPKVIILYGPPGAGKGTQANLLSKFIPEYAHVDFGTELRAFVDLYLNSNHNTLSKSENNPEKLNDNISLQERAIRIKNKMNAAKVVPAEDLRFVLEKKINEIVLSGQGIILEGPGRMLEEAYWLSTFLSQSNVDVCMFHLHLTLEDIIPRLKHRYFIPGVSLPYSSYSEAKEHCPDGVLPFQREDDENSHLVTERYRSMYKKIFPKILFIYQLKAHAQIFIIDASDAIEVVAENIKQILNSYYINN
jgi:adenylate kinase family enzyme